MIKRGKNAPLETCIVCGSLQPQGRYHEFPWHLTCPYDEAGRKKVAAWQREQKKLRIAELPKMV